MSERLKKCNKFTCQTPHSAKIKSTHDYVDELVRNFSHYESSIPTAVKTRPLSLIYEILMRNVGELIPTQEHNLSMTICNVEKDEM
jgi:hypothetical protein